MKKIFTLLTVILVGFSVNEAFAQPSSTGTTNLNVIIEGIQSIVVNSTDVDLTFDDPSHFSGGVLDTKTGHLTITSSGNFIVSVKAAGDLMNGLSSIPIGNVKITATATGTPTFTAGNLAAGLALSSAPAGVTVLSGPGVTTASVDIGYNAIGGSDFLNIDNGTYTTVLTYTIAPN